MAPTHANTWPPLISADSWDGQSRKQLYGKDVLASALIEAEPSDEFFYPVDGRLSGYSSDGVLFQNGAEADTDRRASWFQEEPGAFRGDAREFPRRGLVIVTDAGLSILSLEDDSYTMWMLALRGDSLAFSHNFLGSIAGFYVADVHYQTGRVTISLEPDPGSEFKAPVFITFDFARDEIYMDRGTYTPPIIGPYTFDPVTYRVGVGITPNPCAVNLTEGGRPTFWSSYPPLPAGLTLDPETGLITGTPTEVAEAMAYVVTAYNPGGEGATTVTLAVGPPPPPVALKGGWVSTTVPYGRAPHHWADWVPTPVAN